GQHVYQFELQRLEAVQGLAKLLALVHIAACRVVSTLCSTYRTRGDVYAPAVQTLHGDFKSFAFATEQVFCRYLDVFERNRSGRLTIPAHLFFFASVGDSR